MNPVYSYTPFSPERWKEFSAEIKTPENPNGSVGKYFLAHIKNNGSLTFAKVEEQAAEEAG